MGTLIIVGIIAFVAILFAILGLKTISQSETMVIERLVNTTLHYRRA